MANIAPIRCRGVGKMVHVQFMLGLPLKGVEASDPSPVPSSHRA
jgi:hypothetical protein